MAAFTEYQQTPWLASINNILSRTQKNLRRTRQMSQNRSKSFFLNSSELLSTNFSLEKSDHFEFEVEYFKKEFVNELEEGIELIENEISKDLNRIRNLENVSRAGGQFKQDTICEIEDKEMQIMRKIGQIKRKQICSKVELDYLKSNLIKKIEEHSDVLKKKLRNTPKVEREHQNTSYNFDDFTKDFIENSKFVKIKEKSKEVSNTLLKNCKTIKRKCRDVLNQLPKPENFLKVLHPDQYLNTQSNTLEKDLQKEFSFTEENEKISQVKRVCEKAERCYRETYQSEIRSLNEKICYEINEISSKEGKINLLIDRVNRLELKKKKIWSYRAKPPENFTRININYMGESDEDSMSITSPTPSPLNQRLNPMNSTKHSNKNFRFSGDTIHENPDEYERFSPEVEHKH